MASLSNIIAQRTIISDKIFEETNLIHGDYHLFLAPGTQCKTSNWLNRTWTSPDTAGTAIIEVWGASGSAPCVRCCGYGLPGNPGAYAKKTINFSGGALTLNMTLGASCNDSTATTFKGTSGNSCVCWSIVGGLNGTICAGGGRGGTGWCSNAGSNIYCCAIASGFCYTNISDLGDPYYTVCGISDGCGMICNIKTDAEIAVAIGGDINKPGGFSCTLFQHCNPCCRCHIVNFVKSSPGRFSCEGVILPVHNAYCLGSYMFSGEGTLDLLASLSSVSRTPVQGQPTLTCLGSSNCGNQQNHTLYTNQLPYGIPANGQWPYDGNTGWGFRGGMGAIKLNYKGLA